MLSASAVFPMPGRPVRTYSWPVRSSLQQWSTSRKPVEMATMVFDEK
jgi:hypothetical protein